MKSDAPAAALLLVLGLGASLLLFPGATRIAGGLFAISAVIAARAVLRGTGTGRVLGALVLVADALLGVLLMF